MCVQVMDVRIKIIMETFSLVTDDSEKRVKIYNMKWSILD